MATALLPRPFRYLYDGVRELWYPARAGEDQPGERQRRETDVVNMCQTAIRITFVVPAIFVFYVYTRSPLLTIAAGTICSLPSTLLFLGTALAGVGMSSTISAVTRINFYMLMKGFCCLCVGIELLEGFHKLRVGILETHIDSTAKALAQRLMR